jgi:tetratricopeptide (TPR) repeat protein
MLTLLNKHKAFILGWTAGIITVLLVVLVIWLIQSAQTASKLESYRKEAVTYFEEQHYEEALIACEKILELSPTDKEIDKLREKCMAVIMKNKLKMKEAEAEAKRMKEHMERRTRARVILDRASSARAPDDKIRIAQDALKIDPTYGDAYQAIGYAYKAKAAESGRSPDAYRELIDKAYEYFSKAIEATPTQVYSCYERALITAYIYNRPEDAIPDLEKVLQHDPQSHIGWFAKGTIELGQKKYDEAIQDYTRAIEIYPNYEQAYKNRAITYAHKGNYNKAIADGAEFLRLTPGDPSAEKMRQQIEEWESKVK